MFTRIYPWFRHWLLLSVTGLGMLAAVVLVCMVPLLSATMITADLRSTLRATPQNTELTLSITTSGLSTQNIRQIVQVTHSPFQHLHAYIDTPPQETLETPQFSILSPPPLDASDQMSVYGTSMQEAAPHLQLLQGRLPGNTPNGTEIDVVVTPETASLLRLHIGSIIVPNLILYPEFGSLNNPLTQSLTLRVVGLIEVKPGDLFWHGYDFLPEPSVSGFSDSYVVLASEQSMLAAFDHIAQANQISMPISYSPVTLTLYYHLDTAHIFIDRLNDLITQLKATQSQMIALISNPTLAYQAPYVRSGQLTSLLLPSTGQPTLLQNFLSTFAALRIPVFLFAAQILCLLFFFLSIVTTVLMERQTDAIGQMRSRGASMTNILRIFFSQCVILALLALLIGLPLAYVVVYLVALHVLPATEQDAVNVLSHAPLLTLWQTASYALIALVIALAVMLLALVQVVRESSLQAARSLRRPLWQRLSLDILAAVIGLVGYVFALYLASIQNFVNPQTQALIVTPLEFLAPTLLLLAVALLFLRLFPTLLQLSAQLAQRGRGAVALLTLAQIARAPRLAVRLLLLLALAIAFALFTAVFAASQTQRLQDVAFYAVGADFSGTIPFGTYPNTIQSNLVQYQHLPGVLHISAGYVENDSVSSSATALPVYLQAIDPATFAQATNWPAGLSSPPLPSLLRQLAQERQTAIEQDVVPVIVNAALWNALHLQQGTSFALTSNESISNVTRYSAGVLHYRVIGEITYMPGLPDASEGAMLVDFQTFAAVQAQQNYAQIFLNHVWLQTTSNPTTLVTLRRTLTDLNSPLRLDQLADRRALLAELNNNPLALDLSSLLFLGASAVLLLALIGNLLLSWLNVRRRLTSFLILRALGTDPTQLSNIVLWEQSLLYISALLLGGILGYLLTATVAPILVAQSLPPAINASHNINVTVSSLQQALPVTLVWPTWLIGAALALILIFVLSLLLLLRIVRHTEVTQFLRIDENQSRELQAREEITAIALSGREARRQQGRSGRLAMTTVARWQLHGIWWPWLMQTLGMIVAVTLVCVVPLSSALASSAELYTMLSSSPEATNVVLSVTTQGLSSQVVAQAQQEVTLPVQQALNPYLMQNASAFSIIVPELIPLALPSLGPNDHLQLIGTTLAQAGSMLHVTRGQLPDGENNGDIEAIVTSTTAQALHVGPGSIITIQSDFFTNPRNMFGGTTPTANIHVLITGIAAPDPRYTPAGPGVSLQPTPGSGGTIYPLLISNTALLHMLDALTQTAQARAVFYPQTFELRWFYHLNPASITVARVNPLTNTLNMLQGEISNNFGNIQNKEQQSGGQLNYPYLLQVTIFNTAAATYTLPTLLGQYSNRVAVLSIPVVMLATLVFVFMLLLINLLMTLLVERQAGAVAVLFSRGASRNQVFGIFLTQGLVPGLLSLFIGPVLAVLLTFLFAPSLLGTSDPISPINSFSALLATVGWYAVGSVVVMLLVVTLLLLRMTRQNIVLLRRERARSIRYPFWQRFYLDFGLIFLALIGYASLRYLNGLGTLLDIRTQTLIITPLTFAVPLLLLIGLILLFFRCFSPLLTRAEWAATRRRGPGLMLALTQMARAPLQTLRTTLLLALAITFAMFTLIFSASQSAHISTIASYESGADFSGDLPANAQPLSLAQATALYQHISGVAVASAGFVDSGTAENITPGTVILQPLQIEAVDTNTFASTAIWTNQDSAQPLSTLMEQLARARRSALSGGMVPAIIDAATAHALALVPGNQLSINMDHLPYTTLNCEVVAIVQHIPGVNNGITNTISNTPSPGGMLVDYTAYAAFYAQNAAKSGAMRASQAQLPVNHVWLRSQPDPTALTQVRVALNTPQYYLTNLYDRQALMATMSADPLFLNLQLILLANMVATLLLALGGNMLAAWQDVRERVGSFVVLRSLGATAMQAISVLLWEQGIVYAIALVLGIVSGVLFALLVVPTLTVTSIPVTGILSTVSSSEFYVIQHMLPAQVVLPPTLALLLPALVVVIALTLWVIVREVVTPPLGQTLRVDED